MAQSWRNVALRMRLESRRKARLRGDHRPRGERKWQAFKKAAEARIAARTSVGFARKGKSGISITKARSSKSGSGTSAS